MCTIITILLRIRSATAAHAPPPAGLPLARWPARRAGQQANEAQSTMHVLKPYRLYGWEANYNLSFSLMTCFSSL